MRLLFALLGIAMGLTGSGAFAEFRRPPPEPGGGWPRLAPLLVAPDGRAIATRAAWRRQARRLRESWLRRLGPFPRECRSLRPELLAREELPDHTRLLLRYEPEPGAPTEAYLLLPKGVTGRRPGMVVFHQTAETHLRQPVGLDGRETMHLALHLVRRGFVCVAPSCYLYGYRGKTMRAAAEEVLARWPGWTGMGKMTWDGIRAMDLLVSRPEVDPRRVGSIGHSLGAKQVLYHAAFDERVRAAVSCEGGIGLTFSNWDAPWYLGPQIRQSDFDLEHHQLLALVAPRAFLLIGGESADGARSWPFIAANLPVWRLFGAEERLGLMRHAYGHDFPPPGPEREAVYRWLEHWLAADRRSDD